MIDGSQSFFNLQEMLLRDSKNGQGIGEAGGIISAIAQILSLFFHKPMFECPDPCAIAAGI